MEQGAPCESGVLAPASLMIVPLSTIIYRYIYIYSAHMVRLEMLNELIWPEIYSLKLIIGLDHPQTSTSLLLLDL